jgi:hypothetical protein
VADQIGALAVLAHAFRTPKCSLDRPYRSAFEGGQDGIADRLISPEQRRTL